MLPVKIWFFTSCTCVPKKLKINNSREKHSFISLIAFLKSTTKYLKTKNCLPRLSLKKSSLNACNLKKNLANSASATLLYTQKLLAFYPPRFSIILLKSISKTLSLFSKDRTNPSMSLNTSPTFFASTRKILLFQLFLMILLVLSLRLLRNSIRNTSIPLSMHSRS